MANILVVQDVEGNIADIKLSLEPGGHQLFIAKSIVHAELLLAASVFDLLICGVHLNESNVFDLLKLVKTDSSKHAMMFVFFCANPKDIAKYVSGTVRNTAMILGADKYITQDVFDRDLFRREIESLLPQIAKEIIP